jgi:hypothetical protein
MKLPGASRRRDPGREARIAFRLQSLRFRKMVEKVRALFALLEDGREKMGGDYILDRHYVESLADEAMETASSVVFDACVLVAECREDLYARFDAHRSRARGMLVAEAVPDAAEPGDADLEPEYRLLSGILEWFDGRRAGSGETLMGFIRQVLDRVATRMERPSLEGLATETLHCTSGGVRNSVRLADLGTDVEGSGSVPPSGGGDDTRAEAGHRLLRLLFAGAKEGEPGSAESRATDERVWLVVADEGRLSLCRTAPSAPLRLEAYVAEAPDTGALFLHATEDAGLEARLPPGFRIERADGRVMAWVVDPRADSLETVLVRLGSILFC